MEHALALATRCIEATEYAVWLEQSCVNRL
jgi:hypothetical protein